MIRDANPKDALQIAEIYKYYVLNTTVTFEEEPVTTETMMQRIYQIIAKYPWLVYEQDEKISAYAFASEWKSRCAYKYSVETTIYLQQGLSGKGMGSELYNELLERLKKLNLHGVIGGVALPNERCIALHEKFKFEKVAHFKEVSFKFNKWIDVTYWEKIL